MPEDDRVLWCVLGLSAFPLLELPFGRYKPFLGRPKKDGLIDESSETGKSGP